MKDIYKRLRIEIDLKEAQKRFINKINNILLHGAIFAKQDFRDKVDLAWLLCNKLGLDYEEMYEELDNCLEAVSFEEYLARIQCILSILFEYQCKEQYDILLSVINEAIENSATDLGIRLKIRKNGEAYIEFSGSKLLDEKMVDEVLGVLSSKEKEAIRLAFEKGLKEFLQSRNDLSKLKNTIRDMQLACDETVKFLFREKNLGLKHLFKDGRCEKIGLNKFQGQIFHSFNEYIDKMAKHKADSEFSPEDAETIIYLTGMFIRLTILKTGK